MIPEAAVDAGLYAWGFSSQNIDERRELLKHILEAAAPHMLAEAWSEGFTDYYYLDRGHELNGRQDYELPSNLADDVKVWNRYRPKP